MQVRFDSMSRLEIPKLYVCNPGSIYNNGMLTNMVGILSNTTDEELVLNFSALSELNFRVYKTTREDPDENAYIINLYRSLQNRRLIFVEGVGYFIIMNVSDGYSEGVHYKDIRASSCEVEIENKMLTYIENGTYKFTDLFEKIVATLPMWTIGEIDDAIKEKYRTFEDVSVELNTLSFIQTNMQEAYECIFIFDCINRVINVYDQNNYVQATQIHITKNDIITSMDISENSDDLYTAISVFGDENLNISPINPLGGSVIYNFDYYLSWMTDGLREKVVAWKDVLAGVMDEYYNLNLSYYDMLTEQSRLQSELKMYETQVDMYRRCRENIVAEGSLDGVEQYNEAIKQSGGSDDDLINIMDDVAATLEAIDDKIATCVDLASDTRTLLQTLESGDPESPDTLYLQGLSDQIGAIHSSVDIKSYFTQDEYDELYNYIYEGSYSDEYITVTDSMTYSERFQQMKTLYDRAVAQLEVISRPTQEFNIDVENFIFVPEFETWSEQLKTGTLVNVELEDGDVAMLFLSTITVNYYDRTLSLTFGNRFNKFDPKSLFENVLGNIKKSSNTLDYIKEILYPIKHGELNSMREAIQNSRTLTKNAVLSSTNEEVVIDDTGYTGRKLLSSGYFDPRQVKITGRNLVFTDDAWETCKVAIGEIILGDDESTYGINAQTIIGELIMGNSLRILDANGNDLFTVMDGKIAAVVSNYDDKISSIEQTADGIRVQISNIESSLDREITSVRTTTGYTFNADGLTIHKDGEEITNKLDNTGMYVNRGEEDILIANNEGVEAINLTAKQYLVVGANTRFENFATESDDSRTGCFFIG